MIRDLTYGFGYCDHFETFVCFPKPVRTFLVRLSLQGLVDIRSRLAHLE